MSAETKWKERKLLQRLEGRHSSERFVDFGIRCHVVRQDLDSGRVVFPGRPPVRVVDTREHGGLVDPYRRVYVGPSRNPLVWYVSEAQAPLLFGETGRSKTLVFGAAGAGKTNLLAKRPVWLAINFAMQGLCEFAPLRIGVTAATVQRLDEAIAALYEVCRPEWFHHQQDKGYFTLRCGVRLDLRATKEQSAATGSPIQGQNWAAHVGDEYQDQTHAHKHIVSRGRSAPYGVYRQLVTATAKDSAVWRDFRDGLSEDLWSVHKLKGWSNPFVWPDFWEQQKKEMSDREYRQMVLAEDVPPERAMFPAWKRGRNLQPLPLIGAKDVTKQVTNGYSILVGHDPGTLRTVSVLLKAYRLRGENRHSWFVIGELSTVQTTTEEHADQLVSLLHEWHCQLPGEDEDRALVRVDPWTQSDAGTHESVYRQLRAAGLKTVSANYRNIGTTSKPAKVHVAASVEMVNRLLCSAAGETRLYLALDEEGKPMARQTARALELAEWKPDGYRENVRKDDKRTDWSDYHSALRYALWSLERPKHRRREASVA